MYFFVFFLCFASALLGEEVRLFDTFMFCNELDMLELRLTEHDSAVDYFILVEATKTFTGLPKPLYFEHNKERFAKWKDKIIHLIIDDLPEEMNTQGYNPWYRELYMREFALATLEQLCTPKDLILHSDLDEIASQEILNNFKKLNNPVPHCLLADLYYYNCNWIKPSVWAYIYIAKYEDVKKKGLNGMRFSALSFPKIEKAAWHLSYFMTPLDIVGKIRAFSHTEVNKPEFTDLQDINEAINSGKDLFQRGVHEDCRRAEKNDRLPKEIGILPASYQRTE